MFISTKGRYSLRVMIDLAEHSNENYIPMKEVAERQGISLKYLERLTPVLTKNHLISGVHGKGGGYKLTREPDQYTVWEILSLAEGELAPVACLGGERNECDRAMECRTLPIWEKYYQITKDYFSGITVADLMMREPGNDYVI